MAESTKSLDSLGEMRLVALLGDLIGEHGKTRAAETLGVSPRTLTRFEESRRLTPTVSVALERHLLEGGGTGAAQQRRQVAELVQRVARVEQALVDELEELRKEQARAWKQTETRLAALEAAGNATAAVNGGAPTDGGTARSQAAGQSASAKPVVKRPRRDFYDLVTAEAEPGEELVYGDAATAVIVQGRDARGAVPRTREGMDRLNARQRRLELEIALIEEHKLTLPPVTYPWDWGDRRQEVRRRNEMLDEVIVDCKMLKLRRFLTLGIWRK